MRRTVSVWDAGTGDVILHPFQAQEDFVRGLVFSPNGLYLATGGKDGQRWNCRTK